MSKREERLENGNKVLGDLCCALQVTVNGGEAETQTRNILKSLIGKPKGLGKEEELCWEKLKLLQCPFSWDDLHKIKIDVDDTTFGKSNLRIAYIVEKVKQIEEADTVEYRKSVLNVALVYEHFCNGSKINSLAALRETDALLESSNPGGVLSKYVTDIKAALQHIVLACRAYMQFYSRELGEMERTVSKITQFEDLNDVCKAAVYSIHGATLMEYAHKGDIAAEQHIRKALALDPNQGELHFLLGRCLGKVRRKNFYFQAPAHEELKELEEAMNMNPENVQYMIFLAQAYRESAFIVYSEQRQRDISSNIKEVIDKMNKKSWELCREALKLRPNCPHVNMRCAQGLMKLGYPYKDLALVKECLDKALQRSPNNAMANHMLGKFYNWHEKNTAEARKYLKRASELGAFGAFMDLVRLEYLEDRNGYDPVADMEMALKKYEDAPYQQELLLQIGSYHLFIKDDIAAAFKYWERAIEENPDNCKLKMHKCIFQKMLTPVNVYELLCDEARLALASGEAEGKESLYEEIIMKCKQHHPECCAASPLPRRKMVLEEAAAESARYRPRTQERGRERGMRGVGRGSKPQYRYTFQ